MPTKAEIRRRVLSEDRNPGVGAPVEYPVRLTGRGSSVIRFVSDKRNLVRRGECRLGVMETASTALAHRDFLRRFLHDLATPLSAVSLHLEAADRRVRRGADPSESLAIARAEIARAFDLFDRGRELLLLEPSAEEPVPFDELVSSVLAGSGAGEAKVAGRTGGFVRGDRSALSDMLRAVLTNALEA